MSCDPTKPGACCQNDGYGGCIDTGCEHNMWSRCINNNGTCQCLVDYYYDDGCASDYWNYGDCVNYRCSNCQKWYLFGHPICYCYDEQRYADR
jgi:hypothetical protein